MDNKKDKLTQRPNKSPSSHFYSILELHDMSPLWGEVSVCPLYILLQSAVILLTPGKVVIFRDFFPRPVVRKRKWNRTLVLKEALQVSLSQLGGIVQSVSVKKVLLFLCVSFPECQLQVADFGTTIFTAGSHESHDGRDNDNTPAQDLWNDT